MLQEPNQGRRLRPLEEDLLHLSSRWSGRYVRPNSPHPDSRASLRQQKVSGVQLRVRKRISQPLKSHAHRVDLRFTTAVPFEQAGHVLADDQLRAEAPRVLQNAMNSRTCLASALVDARTILLPLRVFRIHGLAHEAGHEQSPHPGRRFARQ